MKSKISSRFLSSKFKASFTIKSNSSNNKMKGLVSPIQGNINIDLNFEFSKMKSFKGRTNNLMVNEKSNLSNSGTQLDKEEPQSPSRKENKVNMYFRNRPATRKQSSKLSELQSSIIKLRDMKSTILSRKKDNSIKIKLESLNTLKKIETVVSSRK